MVSESKMREILFRGKRTKNGEWVYGLLWHYNDKAAAIYSDRLDRLCWVVPETVGQFTGLFTGNDNNPTDGGEKIYDGDIVDVVWSDEIGEPHHADHCEVHIDDLPTMHLCEYANRIRLVGNIHDNPELLEVRHG